MDDTLRVSKSSYLVLIMREVSRHTVSEVLTNLIVPVQLNFVSLILDITSIYIRSIGSIRQQHWSTYQPVFCGLLIPVESHTQTVIKETCIETEVKLFRSLPFYVLIRQDVWISTQSRIILIVEVIRIVKGYCCQILEIRYVTVTILSPAGTNLQEVHPCLSALHKLLVTYNPTS